MTVPAVFIAMAPSVALPSRPVQAAYAVGHALDPVVELPEADSPLRVEPDRSLDVPAELVVGRCVAACAIDGWSM